MPDDTIPAVPTPPQDDDAKLVEILAELTKLNTARNGLHAFTKFTKPDLLYAQHQVKLCAFLDDLIAGRALDEDGNVCRNVVLTMPPRSAKSEFTSRRLLPYICGRVEAGLDGKPPATIEGIVVSASEALARGDFGFSMRECIESEQYQRLFPQTRLSERSAAGDEFKTARGSTIITRPLGGQIVGRGVSERAALVLDDPYKSREDLSPQNIAAVMRYWRSVLVPRCKPGAVKIVVLTRWHVSDIAATLLDFKRTGTSPFILYNVPAVTTDEQGVDHSWYPEVFSLPDIHQIAADISELEFQAQYLGRPVNPIGTLFRKEHFRYHQPGADFNLEECYAYASVDLAYTEGGDNAAIGIFAVDPIGQVFVLHIWFARTGTLKTGEVLRSLCQKYYVRGIVAEKDPAFTSAWAGIKRTFSDMRQTMPRLFDITTYGGGLGKVGKSEAIRLLLEKGHLFFPPIATCPQWEEAELHLLAFTGQEGGEDAVADVMSNFGRVAHMFRGRTIDPHTGLVNKQFGPDKKPYDPSKAFGGQVAMPDVNDTGMNMIVPDNSRY